VSVDSRDEIPGRGGPTGSASSPNNDLVSVGVLADDFDRNLVATVEAQCRMLTHDRIIAARPRPAKLLIATGPYSPSPGG
jgi:hypothetical protein